MAATMQTLSTNPLTGTILRGTELASCYEGETLDGERHGVGTFRYPNRFYKYEGDWVRGKKHGRGRLEMGDGSFYEGEFVNDEIEGEGYRKFGDGATYSGMFRMGEMCGEGVHIAANGDRYEGSYVDNVRKGEGTLTWVSGDQYVGGFARHKQNGNGILTTAGGDRYEGEWLDGKEHGAGSFAAAGGDTYEGDWRTGKREGEGRALFSAEGITYEGLFADDVPVDVPIKLVATWAAEEGDKDAGVKINVPASQSLPEVSVRLCLEREKEIDPEAEAEAEAAKPPPKGGKGAPPPEEPQGPVMEDITVGWETGRLVTLTLHKGEAVTDEETGAVTLGVAVPLGTQPPKPPQECEEGYEPPPSPKEGEEPEEPEVVPPNMEVTARCEGGTLVFPDVLVPLETEGGLHTLHVVPAGGGGAAGDLAPARILVNVGPPPKN